MFSIKNHFLQISTFNQNSTELIQYEPVVTQFHIQSRAAVLYAAVDYELNAYQLMTSTKMNL
jgi:hypothetical protein